MKVCSKCKEEKAITDFSVSRNMKDGRLNQCRACRSACRADRNRANGVPAKRILKYSKETIDTTKELIAQGVKRKDIQAYFDERGIKVKIVSLIARINLEKKAANGQAYISDVDISERTENLYKKQYDAILYNPFLSYAA